MRLTSALWFAVVLAFGLAGCGGDDTPGDPAADAAGTATTSPAPSPAPPAGGDAPAGPTEQTRSGELAAGDETLQTGEYADTYGLTVRQGQTVVVDVTTDGELDPYVILRAPGGTQEENDDHEGSTQHARVEHVATEAGYYSAIVTSYEPGETGSYTATMTVRD